jgi:hypothetical protein
MLPYVQVCIEFGNHFGLDADFGYALWAAVQNLVMRCGLWYSTFDQGAESQRLHLKACCILFTVGNMKQKLYMYKLYYLRYAPSRLEISPSFKKIVILFCGPLHTDRFEFENLGKIEVVVERALGY